MPITALADIKSNFVDITTIPSGQLSGVVLTNGAAPLTANWNAGGFTIRSQNSGDWINVTNLGGLGLTSLVGDGATDNTAAFNVLIASLPAQAGEVLYFPTGVYVFASAPTTLNGKNQIEFRGEGQYNAGAGGGQTGTIWRFTGSGAGNFITTGNSSGLRFTRINFDYSNAGFTGVLVNGDGGTGTALNYSQFDKCCFGSTTVAGPYPLTACLSLDNAVDVMITDCIFECAVTLVRGRSTVGHATNGVYLRGCIFQLYETQAILDPGEAWSLDGCTFEPTRLGVAGAFNYALATQALGLSIKGCWFGDVTSGSGIWLRINGRGVSISGCRFGGTGTTTGIQFNGGATLGAQITGNNFVTFSIGIDLTTNTTGILIAGNWFATVTTPVNGLATASNTDVWVYGNTGGTLDMLRSSTLGTLFSQTANSTTTANTLTTIFGAGIGSLVIPSNVMAAGRAIRIRAGGFVGTADGGAGTKTLQINLNGTPTWNASSGTTFTATLNLPWHLDMNIVCRSTGTPGVGCASGSLMIGGVAGFASGLGVVTGGGPGNMTTTSALTVDVLYNNGNATGSITTTYAMLEVVPV